MSEFQIKTDALAVNRAFQSRDEFSMLVCDVYLVITQFFVQKALFRHSGEYIAGFAATQEVDVAVDGEGDFSVGVGSRAHHRVGQREKNPALSGAPGVDVLRTHRQLSFSETGLDFKQFHSGVNGKFIVFEVIQCFHIKPKVHLILNRMAFLSPFCANFGVSFPKSDTFMQILMDPILCQAAPNYVGCALLCSVRNTDSDSLLWKELDAEMDVFRSKYVVEDIHKLPGIYEMRQLYKKLGKDPNRYRPSAEALCRRILKNKDWYRINTLVDLINLVSIRSGFSIGGFDLDNIQGDLTFGVGKAGEDFEAIGRGMLNIEGLPVYRDAVGGIGTPTSDVERTKISLNTRRLLMVIHSANGANRLDETKAYALDLLKRFCQVSDEQSFSFGNPLNRVR